VNTTISPRTEQELWDTFFTKENVYEHIREVIRDYPDRNSQVIDAEELGDFDPEFKNHLYMHPLDVLAVGDRVLSKIGGVLHQTAVNLTVRIGNVSKRNQVHIRDLRSRDVGFFISIPGIVTKITSVDPRLEIGIFRCVCSHVQKIHQYEEQMTEPFECPENEGGCGRKGSSTKFTLLFDKSTFNDSQKIEIQELHENVKAGAQPQRIRGIISGDIVGDVHPGDEVVLNSVLIAQERRKHHAKSTTFDKVLLVNSIEKDAAKTEDIELTSEDIVKIKHLARTPTIYTRFRDSLCPAIQGMNSIKDALVLQLFGGVGKEYLGTHIRGDIHILLIGDPGTGKSQLLQFMTQVVPRAVFASGQASTKAGLTATAVKDDFGEGRWSLEAGALVLADKGLAAVDELDKMNAEDRSSMHEALEQQKITVNKAGIHAELPARCALIAAANPKNGRFDPYKNIAEEINLPPPLLTRFDVIFPILDKPNRETDSMLAEHIVAAHHNGQIAGMKTVLREEDIDEDVVAHIADLLEMDQEDDTSPDLLDPEFIKKYVAYARKTVIPIFDPDAAEAITKFYVEVRNSKQEDETWVPITPRQLEAIIRLSEASAKVRLSNVIEKSDITRAITIIKAYITGLTGAEGFDFDTVETGVSTPLRKRMTIVQNAITSVSHAIQKRTAPLEGILNRCDPLTPHDVEATLEMLRHYKKIYRTKDGSYGVVSGQ